MLPLFLRVKTENRTRKLGHETVGKKGKTDSTFLLFLPGRFSVVETEKGPNVFQNLFSLFFGFATEKGPG